MIAEQAGLIADLQDRMARPERAVSRNSGNSSMPPSADDLPGRKPPARQQRRAAERTARKHGKQPGAPGAEMSWTVPGSIIFAATGADGVPPSGVAAVVETVAASDPSATGFLTVYPAGGTDPGNAAVNFNAGDSQDNDLRAPLVSSVSPTGEETITNHSNGIVDVIVAIRGYYNAPTAPPAPANVDSGLQGGTASVTWSPPETDGGAAITSYTITLYNPDGSVNTSATAEPTASTASITGLSDSESYTVGVVAANAVGTSSSTTTTVNVVPADWTTPSNDELDYSSDWNIDPSTGDLTYADGTSDTMTFAPDGTMTSDVPASPVDTSELYSGPSPAIGNYQCVLKTQDGIVAHTPWHDTASDNQRIFDFYHESYTAKNARKLYGSSGSYWTFQDMICTTGGGESKGDYHLDFVGSAVTLAQSSEYEIGRKWGSGETHGNVNINLNFQVSAGPASVGASVGITPGSGSFDGDIGSDGRFNHYPTLWQKYALNRVNTFWDSPSTFPWDGTTSYEGNASDVLYEWPMGTTGNLKLKTYSAAYVFYVNPG